MNSLPVITGIGLVSVLGPSAGQTWDALLAGRSIADHARAPGFGGPGRAVKMAEQAAGEALDQAGWTREICRTEDSALLVGTSKGAIESWMSDGPGICGLAHIDEGLCRSLEFGEGPRLTISCACASGLHALVRAAMAIASGEARRALVVGVEASVQPLFVSSFRRLGVLAPEGYGCRPFDRERKGFVMSEAAAAVCLESADDTVGRGIVSVDGWAVGGDGTHLTAGDPGGKALRHLLGRVAGSDLDLVHGHGTGTQIHDPAELAAIQSIVGKSEPVLYSHKGALGHSLGAAGLMAIVLNCLCHSHAAVPANVRSHQPMGMGGLRFSSSVIERKISRSLAIAAGFGGPLAVVSLQG